MGARSHRRGGNKPAQNGAYQALPSGSPKKIGQPTRKYPPKDARKNEHKFLTKPTLYGVSSKLLEERRNTAFLEFPLRYWRKR